MVLMVAIGAAAYTYANKNSGPDGENADESERLQPSFLEKLQPIDLLPLERTLTLFEAPNATITFMDGAPSDAAEFLRCRIGEVIYRNPWLAGYLSKDKNRGGAVSLFYDPSSDEIDNEVILTVFEAGEIDLARDTKYEDIGKCFAGHEIVVRCNADLIGRKLPVFRVCIIPDAKRPEDRFALVVSMSHICGDGFTFHKIFKMLSSDCKLCDIETMNPIRKMEFTDAIYDLCGAEEAFYVDKISRSPFWSKLIARDETVINRAAFFIDESWIEGQKEAWEKMAKMEEAEALLLGESSKDLKTGLADVQEDEELSNAEELDISEGASLGMTRQKPAPKDFKVSFASHQTAEHITTNDVLTSWFFRTCDANIGLMPFMLRNRLPQFTDNDAGNYATTIAYPRKDYHSPLLIRESRKTGRRKHTEEPLPRHNAEHRYGISIDWRGVGFQKGGLRLGAHGECRQVLHLPCYNSMDMQYIPKSFSSIHLFNAGPHGEAACTVVAPDFVMDRILASGIVKSMIHEGRVASSDEDTFAAAVMDAKEGRRTSVYKKLLDENAAKALSLSFSPLADDE